MYSKLKLHYSEGCVNVIANERVYWSGIPLCILKGKMSGMHLDNVPRFIYTKKDGRLLSF